VSGAKFYYLRNEAALLELALINYTMHKVVAAGFTPMMTPDLVRESVFEKCGFHPRGQNTQVGAAGAGLAWVGGPRWWWGGGWDGMGYRPCLQVVFPCLPLHCSTLFASSP
jgi:hypothetical protein